MVSLEFPSQLDRWRYLEHDGVSATDGLAVDEAIMYGYGRERTAAWPATLRLYTYRADCALVGRYQNLDDEIDAEFCAAHGVEVGRRPTGGGAIIMGPGQLGVALVARAVADETPRRALKRYASGIIGGLASLGITAAFRSKNDLEVDGRKIAGLGLYLDAEGAILFHTSVLVDLDVERMLSVLRIPGAKLSDKAVERVGERVTTVSREVGRRCAATDVRQDFSTGFAAAFDIELEDGTVSDDEWRHARELAETRYGNAEWIRQRSPRRDARGSAVLKTPAGLLRIYAGVHAQTLKSVLVTGDFNVLPVAIGRLESALKWCRADPERIAAVTAASLRENDLGVPHDAVAGAVWEAARKAIELQHDAVHPGRDGSCYFPEPTGPSSDDEAARS